MVQKLLIKKWLWYAVFAFFISLPYSNRAQSIKRQSISSYGSSVVVDNVLVSQTVGQSYYTGSADPSVSVGYQQPNRYFLKEIHAPALNHLDVSVYPNPASHSITFASEGEIEQVMIHVSDINGRSVFSEKVQNLQLHKINCASWVNGVYLITMYDNKQNNKTLRLIISK